MHLLTVAELQSFVLENIHSATFGFLGIRALTASFPEHFSSVVRVNSNRENLANWPALDQNGVNHHRLA